MQVVYIQVLIFLKTAENQGVPLEKCGTGENFSIFRFFVVVVPLDAVLHV